MRRLGVVLGALALLAALVVGTPPAFLGTASAAGDAVVITELHYNPADAPADDGEFVEILNRSDEAVDLSGWCFSGVTFCFAASTTIAPGGRLVVASDTARFASLYGFAPDGEYGGQLSNGGERVRLRNASAVTVDDVTYSDRAPWPVTADEGGHSLEVLDPASSNAVPENWAASLGTPTPRAVNSQEGPGAMPAVSGLTAPPDRPGAATAVGITAMAPDAEEVRLTYRVDLGPEQDLVMSDDGLSGDGAAGDRTYAATVPPQAVGSLVRYRVEARRGSRWGSAPRTDDSRPWWGWVVADGAATNLPRLQWWIDPAAYDAMLANPQLDTEHPCVLAVDGVVFDGVSVRVRGGVIARALAPKKSWEVTLPKNYLLDASQLFAAPVDEFALDADPAHVTVMGWEVAAMTGQPVIDAAAVRVERNGSFHGVFAAIDGYDDEWRARNDVADDTLYKPEDLAGRLVDEGSPDALADNFDKKNPDDGDYTDLYELVQELDPAPDAAGRTWLWDNLDVPTLVNHLAFTVAVGAWDSNYQNYYLMHPPGGRWSTLADDLDQVMITPFSGTRSWTADTLGEALQADPELREMIARRVRSIYDLALDPSTLIARFEAEAATIGADWDLEVATWGSPSAQALHDRIVSFAEHNLASLSLTSSFAAPLPGGPVPEPAVVIDEVHAATPGGTAGYIEIHNPMDTAVDLSGWQLTGAAAYDLRPGSVLAPGAYALLVGDDDAFRSTWPGRYVLGAVSDPVPAGGGTLELRDASGALVDVATFGALPADAAPDASLELQRATADNADPGSWGPSPSAGGSPGSANGIGGVLQASLETVDPLVVSGSTAALVLHLTNTGTAALTGLVVVGMDCPAAPSVLGAGEQLDLTCSSPPLIGAVVQGPSDYTASLPVPVSATVSTDAYDPLRVGPVTVATATAPPPTPTVTSVTVAGGLATVRYELGWAPTSYAIAVVRRRSDSGIVTMRFVDSTPGPASVSIDGLPPGVVLEASVAQLGAGGLAASAGVPFVLAATSELVVDSTSDVADPSPGDGICGPPGGPCSLRAAVMEAHASDTIDTIRLRPGTSVLASTGDDTSPLVGDLDIAKALTIVGSGVSETTVDAGGTDRIFDVQPGGALLLRDLTLTGGVGAGGGGAVRASDATSLRLEAVHVTNNVAVAGHGGGVLATRTPTELIGVTLDGNRAPDGGAGGVLAEQATMTVTDSTIVDNAAVIGGGLGMIGGGSIAGTVIRGNEASIAGGLVVVDVEMRQSTVADNRAALVVGGGLSLGTVGLEASTVSGNEARAGHGGGWVVLDVPGSTRISAVTLSGNRAGRRGAAMLIEGPAVTIEWSTVVGNSSGEGAALFANGSRGFGFSIGSSLLVANGTSCGARDAGGLVTSLGQVFGDEPSCGLVGSGDQLVSDARLGPLADNGGPTMTHLPLPGSPLIDAGGACAGTDQRGVARPRGPACDVGAVEAS